MTTWQRFCEALERIPNQEAVLVQWRLLVGDDIGLIQKLLRRTERRAYTILTRQGAALSVRNLPDGSCVGVNRESGERQIIIDDERWIYELDEVNLIKGVCQVLGALPSAITVELPASTRMIGKLSADPDLAVPTYLIIAISSGQFEQSLNALVAGSSESFIVFAATDKFLDASCTALLDRQRCLFLPFCEVFQFYECDWLITPIGRRAVEVFSEKFREERRDEGRSMERNSRIRVEREWPDPNEHTTAKVWTVKSGALKISTKTDGHPDETVEFSPNQDGTPTKQLQLMRLLCFKFPVPVTFSTILEEVYPGALVESPREPETLKSTLAKIGTLVSDCGKKLEKAGLNLRILPSLKIEPTRGTAISLQLRSLHRMDDKSLDEGDEPLL
ncbi:hypothetical protein CA54_60580 [Symmachiella macrocystis]|uniref:Uncharacterized protein n=1 Tax=Symmachiella macrocystis TaxID=2527985 RepID=A0A5C6AYV6_9PLAN|nr:hypothetical protein [Symmachiella macrocystis]TWU04176.1 hypothetical protein CA54_60580 [Symmachiella macrocystis]